MAGPQRPGFSKAVVLRFAAMSDGKINLYPVFFVRCSVQRRKASRPPPLTMPRK